MQYDTDAQLLFEMLLAEVCAQFVNVAPSDIDSTIASTQRAICERLNVDHSTVWQVLEENPGLPVMTHVYRDPNLNPLPSGPDLKEYFPWTLSKILNKEIVYVPDTATLPPQAMADKHSWEEYGVHSSLVIPLSVGNGPLIGILAFDNMESRNWPEPLQRRLQILSHVFAQAFDRKSTDRKLRESETSRQMQEELLREYQRALESVEEMIAVVDREYRILIANRQFLKMTHAQVVGRFVGEIFDDGVFEAVVKPRLDECFQGKAVRYEMKYMYPELGERNLLISHFPIEGNGIDRAACVLQDLTERKRAEEALQNSEQKFSKAFRQSPLALTLTSAKDYRYLDVNETFERLTGWRRDEVIGRTPLEISLWVDPGQRAEFVDHLAAKGCIRDFEVRYRRKDGTERIGLGAAELIVLENAPCVLFVIADITDRKRAEEALGNLTRKMVEAQEKERARIARELHDDVNQRLAMLAIELEQLRINSPELGPETQERVKQLREQTTAISDDVQALSHDLHSSQLEYLGAVAAMRSWCREFGERQKMQIDWEHDVRSDLPSEIGLCLFRVLQEALHNAAKHSGVKRIEVQLHEEPGELHLSVRDSGRGFDIAAARQGKGLGLTSMQERVKLVNGTIFINSKPMGGTTIAVRVPIQSTHALQRAAG